MFRPHGLPQQNLHQSSIVCLIDKEHICQKTLSISTTVSCVHCAKNVRQERGSFAHRFCRSSSKTQTLKPTNAMAPMLFCYFTILLLLIKWGFLTQQPMVIFSPCLLLAFDESFSFCLSFFIHLDVRLGQCRLQLSIETIIELHGLAKVTLLKNVLDDHLG